MSENSIRLTYAAVESIYVDKRPGPDAVCDLFLIIVAKLSGL